MKNEEKTAHTELAFTSAIVDGRADLTSERQFQEWFLDGFYRSFQRGTSLSQQTTIFSSDVLTQIHEGKFHLPTPILL